MVPNLMTCFIENDFTLSVSYLDENRSDMNGYIHAQIQIIFFCYLGSNSRSTNSVSCIGYQIYDSKWYCTKIEYPDSDMNYPFSV